MRGDNGLDDRTAASAISLHEALFKRRFRLGPKIAVVVQSCRVLERRFGRREPMVNRGANSFELSHRKLLKHPAALVLHDHDYQGIMELSGQRQSTNVVQETDISEKERSGVPECGYAGTAGYESVDPIGPALRPDEAIRRIARTEQVDLPYRQAVSEREY
jgi:hypothetical protein